MKKSPAISRSSHLSAAGASLIAIVFLAVSFNAFFAVSAESLAQNLLPTDFARIIDDVDMAAIEAHIERLTSLGTRITGYSECNDAAQYIFDTFSLYLSDVQHDYFNVTVPVDYGATVTVLSPTDDEYAAYCLWPNLVSPVVTPGDGLVGNLVYVGDGSLEEFNGKEVSGSIVLMDYNSGRNWQRAMKLGAKAVIFMEPVQTTYLESFRKFRTEVPMNFPRLYVSGDTGDMLRRLMNADPVKVRVKAYSRWEARKASNVIGYIEGTQYPDKIIVLAAHYDSFSPVLRRAPGAEESLGIAALLDLARFFNENRPKYTLMFLALSGHSQAMAGARAYVDKYFFGPQWSEIGQRQIVQISLDLSSHGRKFGALSSGGGYGLYGTGTAQRYFSPLMDFLMTIKEEVEEQVGKTYEAARIGFGGEWSLVMPTRQTIVSTEPFMLACAPAISISTFFDVDAHINTPLDTKSRVDLQNLQTQLEMTYSWLYSFDQTDQLQQDYILTEGWRPNSRATVFVAAAGQGYTWVKGRTVYYNYSRGWYSPLPNALVIAYTSARERMVMTVMSDDQGMFKLSGIPFGTWTGWTFQLKAFVIDPKTGNILYAWDQGKYAYAKPQISVDTPVQDIGYFNLFRSGAITLFDLVDPYKQQVPSDDSLTLEVRDIRSHVVPDHYGFDIASDDQGYSVGTVYVSEDNRVDIAIKSSYAQRYPLGLLLNASEEHPTGYGYELKVGENFVQSHTALHVAEDFFWLDQQRMDSLSTSALPIPLDEHYGTLVFIDGASKAIGNNSQSIAYAQAFEAWINEREVYIRLRSGIEDATYSVPFFSFLLVPCAFLLEIMLFEERGKRRLLTTIGIFVALFVIFYAIHPGFSLASNAAMIVFGVATILLISPVFSVIFGSVKKFLAKLRTLIRGAHFAPKPETETVTVQAFSLGARFMKRRRIMSFLLLFLVVLITVGIICFSSLSTITTIRGINVSYESSYEGILVTYPNWGKAAISIGVDKLHQIESMLAGKAAVAPRAWKYTAANPSVNYFTLRGGNGEEAAMRALLGLTPQEVNVTQLDGLLIEGRWFFSSDVWSCILPAEIATKLGVKHVPARIELDGQVVTVVGIIDNELLGLFKDINGERITPLDLVNPNMFNLHLTGDVTLIIPYRLAHQLRALDTSIAIRMFNESETYETAREIFELSELQVYARTQEGTRAFLSSSFQTLFGWQHQVVPLGIAMLIILNGILGNIKEREREIGIYSSVGLSPLHVGFMFLAESVALGVIGVTLGYVTSVLIGKILTTLMVPVPINFSSTSAVFSVGAILIAVVLTSLYGLMAASRQVNPSLERIWKVPTKPVGDDWQIPLPVLPVHEDEALGILAFMAEFFDAFTREDVGQQCVITDMWYVSEDEQHSLNLAAKLPPYETGIRQAASLVFHLEEERYDCILILNRKSGPRSSWVSTNRAFVNLFRTQLLVWRSIEHDLREDYEKRSAKLLETLRRDSNDTHGKR